MGYSQSMVDVWWIVAIIALFFVALISGVVLGFVGGIRHIMEQQIQVIDLKRDQEISKKSKYGE